MKPLNDTICNHFHCSVFELGGIPVFEKVRKSLIFNMLPPTCRGAENDETLMSLFLFVMRYMTRSLRTVLLWFLTYRPIALCT